MILFYDLETTGLDSKASAITEIACIMLDDTMRQVGSFVRNINPYSYGFKPVVTEESKAVTGKTEQDLLAGDDSYEVYTEFKKWLEKFVSPYDKNDKIIFGGYNNKHFDDKFLWEWFEDCCRIDGKNNYLYSYKSHVVADVYHQIQIAYARKVVVKPLNLKSVAKQLNLLDGTENFHNALTDIKVTIKIFKRL